MIISFISHATEAPTTGIVRIKLNDLDPKIVFTVGKLTGSQIWQDGDFRPGVLHTVVFSTTDDRWFLVSPGSLPNPARDLVPGSVAGMLSSNRKYDPVNIPSELTGYPEFADARDVSIIIDDYVEQTGGLGGGTAVDDDTLLGKVADVYKWYGDGSLGDVDSAASTLQLDLNFVPNYDSLKLDEGSTIRSRDGNAIVRAKDSMTLGCILNPRQASTHLYPGQYYGPDGDFTANADVPDGAGLPTYVRRQDYIGKYRNTFPARVRWFNLANLMANGVKFEQIHGGHGSGYVDFNHASHIIYGRAALMLVSPTIELTSTCKVNLSTRAVNESQTVFDSNGLTEGQGTLPADTTQGGGGVLLLCAETVTISDQAEFACAEGFGADERTMFDIRANHYSNGALASDPFDNFRDAAPGVVVHFNTSDGSLTRLV